MKNFSPEFSKLQICSFNEVKKRTAISLDFSITELKANQRNNTTVSWT